MIVEINLLPWREEKRKQKIKMAGCIYFFGAMVAILIVSVMHVYSTHINSAIKEHIHDLEAQLANAPQFQFHKISAEERDLKIKIKSQSSMLEICNELFHIQTDGVYLKKLSKKSGEIVLIGYADSIKNIYRFMSAMLSIKKIHAVKLDFIHKEAINMLFQIHIVEWG